MPQLSLIVLAAGIGSRYGGLKQIDPLGPNGELIIEYSVYDALRAGFEHIVFVINKEIEEAFCEQIGKIVEEQCDTSYVLQRLDDLPPGFKVPVDRQKPWGTAHATLSCRKAVKGPFAVINADDFYGASSYRLLQEHLQIARDRDETYECCMVGFALEKTLSEHGYVSRGVCQVDRDGYLVEVRERTHIRKIGDAVKYRDGENWIEISPGSIASMNMWGFTPSLFSELESRFARFLKESAPYLDKAEFFLPEVVGDMIKEKRARVRVLPTEERWFGVTYQQDRPRVKQAIEDLIHRGLYPERLWG